MSMKSQLNSIVSDAAKFRSSIKNDINGKALITAYLLDKRYRVLRERYKLLQC